MVGARLEFVILHSFVNANQDIFVYVTAIVDTSKILYEILKPHPTLGFQVGRVQIRIKHNNGKGQNKNCIRRAQPRYYVGIALTITLTEDLHQPFDLLRLAGHSEIGLKLS